MRKCTSREEGVEGLTEQGELRVQQRPVMKLMQEQSRTAPEYWETAAFSCLCSFASTCNSSH